MAETWGLTATGFIPKPESQILSDMQAAELSGVSPNLNLQPPDPLAVFTAEAASEIAELWEVTAELYSGMDPDLADGDQLTGLSLITGTERLGPQATQVPGCVVNVSPGIYLAGTLFANTVGNTAALFTNKEDVNNSGGSAANVTVDFEAVATGPIPANASALQIAQAVTGWNSINNPNAGVVGNNGEDDPDLRLRREEELSAGGSSTPDAIRSAALAQLVTPATSSNTLACTVLHNDGDLVDANGLPAHTIEVVAYQPGNTSNDDAALAQLIAGQKAAGIGTNGTSSANVTDSEGNVQAIKFTRPASTTVYAAVTVKGSVSSISVSNALAAYTGKTWQPGISAILFAMQASLFPSPIDASVGVPGLTDITSFTIGTTYPAVGTTNVPIDVRHIAVLGTVDVIVVP